MSLSTIKDLACLYSCMFTHSLDYCHYIGVEAAAAAEVVVPLVLMSMCACVYADSERGI